MEQKTKSGFSLYINSNENFQNAMFVRERKKKYRIGLAIGLAVVCICCFFAYRYRTYYELKVVKSIAKDLTESFQSFAYKNGTICYSEDGISFLDEDGDEQWNRTYSFESPIASYCGDYIVVASKNGNEAVLLDDTGQMKKFSASYPIVDVEVAKQGVVALNLQGDNGNYIELYEAAKKKLVSIKVTSEQNGYPMDIDLSSDGETLAVSYLVVDGINTKSRIAFYNFGEEGEEKEDQLIGGFDFKDTVIPKIHFMGDSADAAIGDNKLILFKVGSSPSKKNEIPLNKTVKSVAVTDQHIGLVFDNQKKSAEDKYEARVYSKSGRKVMSKDFSSEYNKLLLNDGEMILAGNYHCSILNFAGHEMFQKDFKKRILNISPTGKSRRYLFSYEDSTELAKLQ